MATVPTGKLERDLRALYLRWLGGVGKHEQDLTAYIDKFERDSLALTAKLGGQAAQLGALAGFPAPTKIDLNPYKGTIYSDMKQAAIQAGLMTGQNARVTASAMFKAGMDKSYHRLERLARTETVNAYWKNTWDSTEGLDLVLVWSAESGPRTCDWCIGNEGLVVADRNVRDHPNGRCTLIPMLRSRVDYRGTLQADGSVIMDPEWDKPVKPLLNLDELSAKELGEMAEGKRLELNRWHQELKAQELDWRDNAGFVALREEMQDLYARHKAAYKIETAAKAQAKVGVHPKIDKLPTMPVPDTLKDAYASGAANPIGWLGGAGDYNINCTRVAYTVEMRARGYDITAAAAGTAANKTDAWITDNWIDKAGKKRNLRKANSPDALIKAMLKEPDGARYYVVGPWKGGGAHIWNAEKVNGQIIFHEGQVTMSNSGTAKFTEDRLARMEWDKWQGTAAQPRWMRVDDLYPTDAAVTRGWVEVDGKVRTK